jgi:hypothetical protein
MKTNLLKNMLIAAMVLSMSVFFTSCEDDTANPEESFDTVVDESYTADVYDELEDIGDEAMSFAETNDGKDMAMATDAKNGWGNYNRLSPCATVTKVFLNDTIKITIDFGDTNCLCNDGRERRGKIYINHYGYYWDGDVEIEYSFDNYFVDDNQLTGIRNVHRYRNENQYRQSDIIVNGEIILADEAGTISWYAEHTRIVTAGSDTREKYDDVIEITGFSNGTMANGSTFAAEITTPLVKTNQAGCFRWPVSGVREITINETTLISINYGDGTCDNLAEITKDGVTTTIELNRRRNR